MQIASGTKPNMSDTVEWCFSVSNAELIAFDYGNSFLYVIFSLLGLLTCIMSVEKICALLHLHLLLVYRPICSQTIC